MNTQHIAAVTVLLAAAVVPVADASSTLRPILMGSGVWPAALCLYHVRSDAPINRAASGALTGIRSLSDSDKENAPVETTPRPKSCNVSQRERRPHPAVKSLGPRLGYGPPVNQRRCWAMDSRSVATSGARSENAVIFEEV